MLKKRYTLVSIQRTAEKEHFKFCCKRVSDKLCNSVVIEKGFAVLRTESFIFLWQICNNMSTQYNITSSVSYQLFSSKISVSK